MASTTLTKQFADRLSRIEVSATMAMVAVHINFEFVFMDFVLHYLFAISAGMLVAVNALAKKSARAPVRAAVGPAAMSQAG